MRNIFLGGAGNIPGISKPRGSRKHLKQYFPALCVCGSSSKTNRLLLFHNSVEAAHNNATKVLWWSCSHPGYDGWGDSRKKDEELFFAHKCKRLTCCISTCQKFFVRTSSSFLHAADGEFQTQMILTSYL